MTSKKSYSYCFTINNWTDADLQVLQTLQDNAKTRYLIVGREVGAQGTPHLQCYVYFHNQMVFGTFKKLVPRAHIEICRGTPEQNIEYCSKAGDFFEHGDRPCSRKRKGELGAEYWDNVLATAKSGRIDELDSSVQIRHYRTLRMIERDYMPKVPDNDDTCGVWFYGVTGTGKSRQAREQYPNPYLKMCNKWWDGYQKEEHVLIEDFDKAHHHLGHHLKIWADRYAFLAESKGTAHQIRPQTIIVTSNWHPSEIWGSEPQTLDPILRRFKIHHFNGSINDAL